MPARSRYGRHLAHVLANRQANPPANFGSVTCGTCGRMMPAMDAAGSYICTCGNGAFVDRPPDAA